MLKKRVNLRYIDGHCGGDRILLVYGDENTRSNEIPIALLMKNIITQNYGIKGFSIAGIAFLYKTHIKNNLFLKIVDITLGVIIPMCGGMTQVIGKALGVMKDDFNLETTAPKTQIVLETDSLFVSIEVETKNNETERTMTDMSNYVHMLYKSDVKEVFIKDVRALKVGDFLIFNVDDLKTIYPKIYFIKTADKKQWQVLRELQKKYLIQENTKRDYLHTFLYDFNSKLSLTANVFNRFYKEDQMSHLKWDCQCGAGAIAILVAMLKSGDIDGSNKPNRILLKWGSGLLTQDPFGDRKTIIEYEINDEKIKKAKFSHNAVSILDKNEISLDI